MTQDEILEKYHEARNTPSDINEHLMMLKHIADECKHVTEFGVRGVVSTWALLASRAEKVVSYDICDVAVPAVDKFTFICADVLEIEIEPTDMLFIDTAHNYNQCIQELRRHAHKVSKSICFHDTAIFGVNGDDGGKGLLYAIQEFIGDNPEWYVAFETKRNNGFTEIRRNK